MNVIDWKFFAQSTCAFISPNETFVRVLLLTIITIRFPLIGKARASDSWVGPGGNEIFSPISPWMGLSIPCSKSPCQTLWVTATPILHTLLVLPCAVLKVNYE